jgi:prepilin-type N-terminal cleavage/methylation domain-containing protein
MILKRMPRRGLTLVELLVVLVILVLLTAVAVQSTSGIVDQARYDQTQRTLQNIQNAVVGPTGQREPDGTPLITGFVADLGRLPVATADPITGALTLSELWSNPNNMMPFTLQQAVAPDTDVNLLCGWRGPYLQLQLGTSQLTDGWGNPLSNPQSMTVSLPQSLLLYDGLTPVAAGQPIYWIASYGSDYAAGGTGYAADSVLMFSNYAAGTTPPAGTAINRFMASLVVNLSYLNQAGHFTTSPNGTITNTTVTFFGPNPTTGTVLSVPGTLIPGTTVSYQFPAPAPGYVMTIGPRLVRATCSYTFIPTGTTQATTVTVKSVITPLVLQPGGQTKTVILQFPN